MLETNCAGGRFLLPNCKRWSNAEGLGSSLVFFRAGLAYALLFELRLADQPLLVGHGLGFSAHEWLGLGYETCALGECERLCSADTLLSNAENGSLARVDIHATVDYSKAAGGSEILDASRRLARAGSVTESIRKEHRADVLFTLHGCPRLSMPLATGLADRVEERIRNGYAGAFAQRRWQLPWASAPAGQLQIAAHFRAGDLFTTSTNAAEKRRSSMTEALAKLPKMQKEALTSEHPPPLAFDTWKGRRLLPLVYAVRVLRAIRDALPAGTDAVFWLFSQGDAEWFELALRLFPGIRLQLAPLQSDPQVALHHLDALAHADIFVLGGGAFSELAASLNMEGVSLAPSSVWASMPVAAPIAANVSYPEGELQIDALEALAAVLDRRCTRR